MNKKPWWGDNSQVVRRGKDWSSKHFNDILDAFRGIFVFHFYLTHDFSYTTIDYLITPLILESLYYSPGFVARSQNLDYTIVESLHCNYFIHGHEEKPNIRTYWYKRGSIFHCPTIFKLMCWNHFEILTNALHLIKQQMKGRSQKHIMINWSN